MLSYAKEGGEALFGTLWNLENSRLASHFDRIIRMDHGRIVGEDGATKSTEQQAGPSSEPDKELMRISA